MNFLEKIPIHAIQKLGFKWDMRRQGDLNIGLIRKNWATRQPFGRRKLVWIPGFGDTALSWLLPAKILGPVIRKKYDEIILIDFPGFNGVLGQRRAIHSMDVFRHFLFSILDDLQPECIVGHSLGAWFGAAYSAEWGSGKRKTVGRADYLGPGQLIMMSSPAAELQEAEKAEWRRKFEGITEHGYEYYSNYLFEKPPFWSKFLKRQVESFFLKEEIQAFISSIEDKHFIGEEAAKINACVDFIWGEKDRLNPPHWVNTWAKHLTRPPQLFLIAGTGHCPHLESPMATAWAIAQIMNANTSVNRVPNRLKEFFFREVKRNESDGSFSFPSEKPSIVSR